MATLSINPANLLSKLYPTSVDSEEDQSSGGSSNSGTGLSGNEG